jgi:hypothetical protein
MKTEIYRIQNEIFLYVSGERERERERAHFFFWRARAERRSLFSTERRALSALSNQ